MRQVNIKLRSSILVIWLLTLGCRPTPDPTVKISDLTGEWVVKNYIQEVERTRTPHEVWSSKPWALKLSIRDDSNGGYEFNSSTMHESVLEGTVLRLEPTPSPNEFRMLIAEQADHYVIFQIDSGEKRPIESMRAKDVMGNSELFVRLPGTLDEYVNRLVIAGHYRD